MNKRSWAIGGSIAALTLAAAVIAREPNLLGPEVQGIRISPDGFDTLYSGGRNALADSIDAAIGDSRQGASIDSIKVGDHYSRHFHFLQEGVNSPNLIVSPPETICEGVEVVTGLYLRPTGRPLYAFMLRRFPDVTAPILISNFETGINYRIAPKTGAIDSIVAMPPLDAADSLLGDPCPKNPADRK